MKLTTFLLFGLSVAAPSVMALDLSLIVPFCDDAYVRLSPIKPNCIERKDQQVFEIPTLKINKEDLEKILQGAESSGGRIINPGHNSRGMMSRRMGFSTPFKYACKLRLMADGGKTLSWLSQTDLEINNYKPQAYVSRQDWSHGLIEGNDIDTEVTLTPLVEPQIALDNYTIMFDMKEGSNKVSIEVCQTKIESSDVKTSGVCSTAKGTLRSRRLRANFSYKTTVTTPNFVYKQSLTLDLNCKRLHK
jgi:hypothetical protein